MPKEHEKRTLRPIDKQKYGPNTILLVALVGLVIVYPSIEIHEVGAWVAFSMSSLLLLGSYILLSNHSKYTLLILLALGLPMVCFGWLPILDDRDFHFISAIFNIAFLIYIITHVTSNVLTAPRVTRDVLAGSIAVYLLLGITWSVAYMAIHVYFPGSFQARGVLAGEEDITRPDFLFFSFVTLSTLGYGDIIPVKGLARSASILEAMTGVIYIAVFVGRIVSLHKPMEHEHHKDKS